LLDGATVDGDLVGRNWGFFEGFEIVGRDVGIIVGFAIG
jgi:hypothetical protein